MTDPTNGRLRSALEELRATYPDVRREFPDAIYANKEDLLERRSGRSADRDSGIADQKITKITKVPKR